MKILAFDYAHESVGFLTWHRLYLLWFEREMQYVLDGTQFTLHYWNWTNQADRSEPFGTEKLGVPSADGTVTGMLMNNWYSVCKASAADDKSVCNPETHRSPGIIRCKNTTKCAITYQEWPNSQSVRRCLMIDQFRRDTTNNGISNKYDKASFGNYLEGFAIDDLCDNGKALCNANKIPSSDFPRRLHNQVSRSYTLIAIAMLLIICFYYPMQVHILLDGTMGDVPIASNDPVFINHHAMIDCIFEQWLRNHPLPNRMYPAQLRPDFAGHAAGDCIVPFIPVYNHSYIFNHISDDFGYKYDVLPFLSDLPTTETPPATRPTGPTSTNTRPTAGQPTTPNSTATTAESAILLFSLIVVCLCIIIL